MIIITDIYNMDKAECLKLIDSVKAPVENRTPVFPYRANYSGNGDFSFAGIRVKGMYIYKVDTGFAIHLLIPNDSYPKLLEKLGRPETSFDMQQVESDVPSGCEWMVKGLSVYLMTNRTYYDGASYKGFMTLTLTNMPFQKIVTVAE